MDDNFFLILRNGKSDNGLDKVIGCNNLWFAMVFRSLIVFITDPRISLLLVRTHSFCSSPKLYCVSNSIPNNVRAEGKP